MDAHVNPKDFMTLTKELTWHAMQEIVKGEPLHSVITGVMLTTKDWVEDQVQDNKPFTEVMDELAKLREENQTLRTGAVEQAKTTEGLKKKLADTDALRESYYLENHRLRNDLELQIAENDGLRQAPEVLKREMNALVQDIAKQRDAAVQQRDWEKSERIKAEDKLAEMMEDRAKVVQQGQELQKRVDELTGLADTNAGIEKCLRQKLDDALGQRDSEKLRADIAVTQRGEFKRTCEELQDKLRETTNELAREQGEHILTKKQRDGLQATLDQVYKERDSALEQLTAERKRNADKYEALLKIHDIADAMTAQP